MQVRGIVVGIFLLLGGGANAAEVSCLNTWAERFILDKVNEQVAELRMHLPLYADTCAEILIQGDIAKGDYDVFESLVLSHAPYVSAVYLHSNGGRVDEALKIGRLIRRYMLSTHAAMGHTLKARGLYRIRAATSQLDAICKGRGCVCASSCFIIWAGGVERHAGDKVLGVHRPSIQSVQYKNMSPDQASWIYKELLEEIRSYLLKMEITEPIIEKMFAVNSQESEWLIWEEASALESPPSINEWVQAKCGRVSDRELRVSTELVTKPSRSAAESMVMESFFDKIGTIQDCTARELYHYRWKIDPLNKGR